MSYTTLDYLPDLTTTQMSRAGYLSFSNYTPISPSISWDRRAEVYGSESYALLHSTYRFTAIAGATYDIFSTSFFDPFVLLLYDQYGNAIVANSESDDGADIRLSDGYYSQDVVWDWVAPYTGTYYVDASWNQGSYFKFYALSLYEDKDTVVAADTTPPSSTSSLPGNGQSNVALTQNLVFTFNESVQRGQGIVTLTTSTGQTVESFDIATSNRVSVSGSVVTIDPTASLAGETTYRLRIPSGAIKDLAGNTWSGVSVYQFSTVTVTNNITGTAGNDNLTGTSGDDKIDALDGNDTLWGGPGNDSLYGGKGSDAGIYDGPYSGYTVTAIYGGKNGALSGYEVRARQTNEGTDKLDLEIESLRFSDGTSTLSGGTVTFTPSAPADTTPPTLALSTDKGVLAIGQSAKITVQLSESSTSFDPSDFAVVGGTLKDFTGTGLTYSATFVAAANYEGTASISVNSGSFTDLAGNAFLDSSNARSQVSIKVDTLAPHATAFVPPSGSTDIALDSKLRITFGESIQIGSGTIRVTSGNTFDTSLIYVTESSKVTVSGSTLVVDLSGVLKAGQSYSISLDTGLVLDSIGNISAALVGYSFSTVAGIAVIEGTAKADRLIGTNATEALNGYGGNDHLDGKEGNDVLNGGPGIDTAHINSNAGSAELVWSTSGISVTSAIDGTDSMVDVERIQFTDSSLALDLDGNAGTVARILGAVFGAAAVSNPTFVGIGLSFCDSGMNTSDLCQFALDARLGASSSNASIVQLIYSNVVGTPPSAEEQSYFVNLLDAKSFTPVSLVMMTMGTQMNETNIDLAGLSVSGLPYEPWLGG